MKLSAIEGLRTTRSGSCRYFRIFEIQTFNLDWHDEIYAASPPQPYLVTCSIYVENSTIFGELHSIFNF